MAQESHTSPTGSEEPGHGGNTDGVLGEQEHRPGVGEKVKHTLANVQSKIKGNRGEHASSFPSSRYHDDPQMRVGHPSAVYSSSSSGNSSASSGGEKGLHHKVHSPRSPQSPRSPRVAVGHNPEFEPLGVGEQAADTVMPGHHVDHHSAPTTPHQQPRVEKFVEKLPGYTANPYTYHDNVPAGAPVDSHEHHHSPSPLRDPERQHVVGEPGTEDLREDHAKHGGKRPGFVSKLKDLVTGQKPGHGAGTGQATTDQIAESPGAHAVDTNTGNGKNLHGGTQSYAQEPTPADVDCFGNVKQMLRGGGNQDAKSPTGWPAPAKPDYHNMPGAVRTDDHGRHVEGPREEGKSPKSEGVMSKIMEKLHIGQQKPSSDPALSSPEIPTHTTPDAATTQHQ